MVPPVATDLKIPMENKKQQIRAPIANRKPARCTHQPEKNMKKDNTRGRTTIKAGS
jgi:hypothetical protein